MIHVSSDWTNDCEDQQRDVLEWDEWMGLEINDRLWLVLCLDWLCAECKRVSYEMTNATCHVHNCYVDQWACIYATARILRLFPSHLPCNWHVSLTTPIVYHPPTPTNTHQKIVKEGERARIQLIKFFICSTIVIALRERESIHDSTPNGHQTPIDRLHFIRVR